MLMKRLRIIYGVDPRHGGPVEGIRQQAPFHAAAGIEEHVLSLDPPDSPWVRDFPLKVFAFGAPMEPGAPRRHRWPLGYEPAFVDWLKAHAKDYDIIMVHGLWNASTIGARQVLVGAGTPYVVFTHGMLDPWFNRRSRLKAAAKQFFWWFNEGPLVNNAQYVFFTSEEEKVLARHSFRPYRAKERVVKYGTSDPGGDAVAQADAFRAALPGLHKPYFLFLSRIHPKKGCDLLIDAFAEVCGHRDDFDLVMAGPSSDGFRDGLMAQASRLGIADRIHWPGMLAGEAKWGAFREAAAFVLPSHQENFGIAVAEAMACGRPVLITDKVNIWQDILACNAGLVERDDGPGVARLLQRFLSMSEDDRAEMGQCARDGFLRMFEIREVAESVNTACRDALQQANGVN